MTVRAIFPSPAGSVKLELVGLPHDPDQMTEPAQSARRTRKYLARQDAIIRAATVILNEKGLKGITLAEVADRVGLVSTGIAYYFRSKEDLAAACFQRSIAAHARFVADAAGCDTVGARIAGLVRSYVERLRQIAVGEADDIAEFDDLRALGDETVEAAYVELFRQVRTILGRGPATLRGRQTLNSRAHYLLQQIVFVRTWLRRYDPADFGRAAERMLAILQDGIATSGNVWSIERVTIPAGSVDREVDPKEAFLSAATQLITEQGFRGASVERIVARLEVTKGAFYYHIDAKDDLIEVCYARTSEVIRRAQQATEHLPLDAGRRLAGTLAHLVDHQLQGDSPLLRSAFTSMPAAIRQKVQTAFDRNNVRFGSMISDGIADGSLATVDVQIAAHMLSASINAAAELGFWLPSGGDGDATETFLRPIFEGLVRQSDGAEGPGFPA